MSTMSTPAAKRRRVDAANAALRKPFQSPVIRRPGPPDGTPGSKTITTAANDNNHSSSSSSSSSSSRTPDAAAAAAAATTGKRRSLEGVYSPSSPSVMRLGVSPRRPRPASPLPKLSMKTTPPGPARPGGKRKSLGAHAGAAGLDGDNAVGSGGGDDQDDDNDENPFAALVRAHRTTGQDAMISDASRQLETARQARKIEAASERRHPGGPVDQELRDLIARWRGAARLAADELFGTVRGRVDTAGGPRAWKAMRQRQEDFYRGFDQDLLPGRSKRAAGGGGGDDGEDYDDGEEGNEGAFERGDGESLLEKEQRLLGEGGPDEDEDEPEFNMAMMLRSLNIDLSLLGYDEAEEKWID